MSPIEVCAFGDVGYLGVFVVVVLLRPDPAADHVVLDGQRQGEVIVAVGGDVPILDESEVQVTVQAFLQGRHRLVFGDLGDTDPAPLVDVRRGSGHRDERGLILTREVGVGWVSGERPSSTVKRNQSKETNITDVVDRWSSLLAMLSDVKLSEIVLNVVI